jgi:hypothetical protein
MNAGRSASTFAATLVRFLGEQRHHVEIDAPIGECRDDEACVLRAVVRDERELDLLPIALGCIDVRGGQHAPAFILDRKVEWHRLRGARKEAEKIGVVLAHSDAREAVVRETEARTRIFDVESNVSGIVRVERAFRCDRGRAFAAPIHESPCSEGIAMLE